MIQYVSVDNIFYFKVFHRIKDEKPEIFKKITAVYGDISSKRLGLSDAHYDKVIASTNIVIHMAASLRLEATLKPNVIMNLTGTKIVLEMCAEMKNLITVLHLSTAFCVSDHEVLREEVYEWPQKPLDLIKCAEWMNEEAMHELSRNTMSPHPNTYTYTKRLSEILVRDVYNEGKLNVCIVRPSIVTPAYKEPLVGWVDSLNG
jgi:alcohol-forming fatty acyl-CoA reductase